MLKKLPLALIAATVLLSSSAQTNITLAGTCASNCGRKPLQLTPGQFVRLEVINNTPNLINIERVEGSTLTPIQPKQIIRFPQKEATQPNMSLIFWDETGSSLQVVVSKPNVGTLRVELRPTWRYPGDRSLYILNDGRVNVL